MIAVGALLLGLLLIFLEFYLPGAVLAILGSLLIVLAVVLFAWISGSFWWTLLFLIVSTSGVIAVVKLAIWRIRISKPGKSIYLPDDQTGFFASSYPKELVGKTGVAITDLKPAGHILINGHDWQATSVSGYLVMGSEVEVIGGEGSHLIVTSKKLSQSDVSKTS